MADLPPSAEVVVIGGGVMGTATLYYLTGLGVRPVLVERATIASGSTSKAAGGFRAQFSDELNIRVALSSIARFQRFHDEVGVDIDFRQCGYLFLLDHDSLESFRASVSLQNRMGVPTRLLTPDEALAMVPGLSDDGIAAASFGPLDGLATPEAVAQGYASSAVRRGASVVGDTTVTAIVTREGTVRGVETSRGTVACDRVVCTAGVWSMELLSPLGIDLPVRAEKRSVWMAGPGDTLPRDLPLTIDFATGFYFQREGVDRLLFGGREGTIESMAPAATHRLPQLADLPIRPGWWGYYAMSPDHNAVVGAADEPTTLVYATGFSGHGFQQSPVVGEYVAHLVLGLEPPLDLSPFALERFRDGIRPEANVV